MSVVLETRDLTLHLGDVRACLAARAGLHRGAARPVLGGPLVDAALPQDEAIARSYAVRFWSKVNKNDRSGCWLWLASRDANGYGRFGLGARPRMAHRVAYELTHGPIAAGLTLDHLCRNRACVFPDHLEPVTQGENTLRGDGPPAINARKTQCPNGHAYDRTTRLATGKVIRGCRACAAEANRTWYAEHPDWYAAKKERQRQKYQADPEYRARVLARNAASLARRRVAV